MASIASPTLDLFCYKSITSTGNFISIIKKEKERESMILYLKMICLYKKIAEIDASPTKSEEHSGKTAEWKVP